MSIAAIRQALEVQLATISPALPTAAENVHYEPTTGTAYQRVHLLAAQPDNIEIGPGYIERGFMQVTLCYPLGNGSSDAMTRAEAIRTAFPFRATFAAGSDSVLISSTPEIGPALIEADFYIVPVRVRFETFVGG